MLVHIKQYLYQYWANNFLHKASFNVNIVFLLQAAKSSIMINKDELILDTKEGSWCLKRSLKMKGTTNWKLAISLLFNSNSNDGRRNIPRHIWIALMCNYAKNSQIPKSHNIKSMLYGESTFRNSFKWFFSSFLGNSLKINQSNSNSIKW